MPLKISPMPINNHMNNQPPPITIKIQIPNRRPNPPNTPQKPIQNTLLGMIHHPIIHPIQIHRLTRSPIKRILLRHRHMRRVTDVIVGSPEFNVDEVVVEAGKAGEVGLVEGAVGERFFQFLNCYVG